MTKENFIDQYKTVDIMLNQFRLDIDSQYTGTLKDRTVILNGTKKTISEVEEIAKSLEEILFKMQNTYQRVYKSNLFADVYPDQQSIDLRYKLIYEKYNAEPKMK